MKTNLRPTLKSSALLALLALTPTLAQAHPGHGMTNSFTTGFAHPLFGMDHVLAMVAVGLWAAQLGGRSRWTVPATFVGVMTLGGVLGMMGIRLPMVEAGIMASVMVLGILIAAAARLPMMASMAIVGIFALFHGHAHGTEIPASASGITYALGFILATAALHACGISLGMLAQKRLTIPALRFAGAAIALAGACLFVA